MKPPGSKKFSQLYYCGGEAWAWREERMARHWILALLALGTSVTVCLAEESPTDAEVAVSSSGPEDEVSCKALPLPAKKQHLVGPTS